MEYIGVKEKQAIYNLYVLAEDLAINFPDELSLLYSEILGENLQSQDLSVNENAALIFQCLYTDYSGTFNTLSNSIDDNSASESDSKIWGCTNPNASNFNPDATDDDGGCIIEGKIGRDACNCTDPNFSCFVISENDPCYDICCGGVGPQPQNYCDDPEADNYAYYAACEYSNNSFGAGLLNVLTTIGNTLWGVVEAIGVDNIYNDIMNNDPDDFGPNDGNYYNCSAGQTYCKSNGIPGCFNPDLCDKPEDETNWGTIALVGLGVVAIGVTIYFVTRNKS